MPGWHETVFPPYFVAGAIFSGFAMVLVLCIPIRALSTACRTSSPIDHLDVMAKILLATSLLTSYGYLSEQFMSWYGGEPAEHYVYLNRLIGFGQYALVAWTRRSSATRSCRRSSGSAALRRSEVVLFVVSLLVLIGMWLERYMIIITSLHRDYLPSSWGMFQPTIWDYLTYLRLDRAVPRRCSCCSSGCCR